MDFGSTFLAILTGLGLSVACGFRLFIPMFLSGLAAHAGKLELAEGFTWLGEGPALFAFGVATACEIITFKVPLLGNIVAKLERPLVVVAGTVLSASSMVADMNPLLQWSLAAIAGGGSAGLLHEGTIQLKKILNPGEMAGPLSEVLLDTVSEEMVNPWLSIAEDIGAVAVSILAILLPVAVLILFPVLIGGSACVIKGVFAIRKRVVKLAINIMGTIKKWLAKCRRRPA